MFFLLCEPSEKLKQKNTRNGAIEETIEEETIEEKCLILTTL